VAIQRKRFMLERVKERSYMHASQSSVGFTTALSRMVLMLRYGAESSEQREALRALVLSAQDSAVELEPSGGEMLGSGRTLPLRRESVEPLLERFAAHGVRKLVVRRGAMAGELADLARILAGEPEELADDDGVRMWNVQLVRGPEAEVGVGDEQSRAAIASLENGDEDAATAVATIEKLVQAASEAGRAESLVEPMLALDRCASARGSGERAALCAAALDEMSTPAIIRQFAQSLPLRSDRAPLLLVLKRSGDVGAHALIAHLMAAETLEERRAYFDSIVALRAGIPRLVDALGHPQWYIVRNAAALLGEMRVVEADEALVPLLVHPHARVREAAAAALSRLGTETARAALSELAGGALTDSRPRIAGVEDDTNVGPSARTLESEPDNDVRLGIIAALGRLATPAAVQRLIRVCTTSAGDTATTLRVAALEALAASRGGASVPVLREFTRDEHPEVRDAARRLIAGVAVQ